MPNQEIPFIGGAYESRSKNVNAQRCINFYPEIDQTGGEVISLQPTPGLKVWKDYSTADPVRVLFSSNDYLWTVIGNTLYRIDANKNSTTCTGTLGTSTGQVYMVENSDGELMIVDVSGGNGYYISGTTVAEITDTDFITPYHLAYQDGYGIVPEKDTDTFWLSALNDFSSWDALDYSSAESLPDDVLGAISDGNELWMLGRKTSEAYQNTANPDFPFERINSVTQRVGISAPASLLLLDNSLFWLDNWGNVRRMVGYTPAIISSHQIGYQISTYSTINNAVACGYVHEGKSFYIITFPSANAGKGVTWCYDVSTGMWHQRASYPNAPDGRWRGVCQAFFENTNLFGDYELGKIYELDHTIYKDDGEILPAVRRGQTFETNRQRFSINRFEVQIEPGVGIATGQGSDPQIMMRYSKDFGHTWSNEKWMSMGKIGEYSSRAVRRRLGIMRSFTPEVTITDPVNRVLTGATIDIKPGIS